MKRAIALTILCAGALAARAEDLPKRLDFARYQGMLDRSPFAVATAVAPPPAAASFAKDLYVANAAKSPDGDLVTIASTSDKNFKKYLSTKSPVDGFSVSNIEWSDKVGATKVTIAKDGQFATLTFNQALLSQPLASAQMPNQPQPNQPQIIQSQVQQPGVTPAMPMPVPTIPGGAPPTNGPIKPAPIPMLPTPPPRVRGVIPRNPGVPQAAQTPQGAVPSPTPEL